MGRQPDHNRANPGEYQTFADRGNRWAYEPILFFKGERRSPEGICILGTMEKMRFGDLESSAHWLTAGKSVGPTSGVSRFRVA